jgi:hypothetical protein
MNVQALENNQTLAQVIDPISTGDKIGKDGRTKLEAAIDTLDNIGAIIELQGPERYRRIAEDYADITSQRKANGRLRTSVVVALTQSEVRRVIEIARATLPVERGGPSDRNVVSCYASQGMVADMALVVLGRESFDALGWEQLYVALSRGREAVRLYTDDKAGLVEAVRKCASAPTRRA